MEPTIDTYLYFSEYQPIPKRVSSNDVPTKHKWIVSDHAANASKLIENRFLDLRNIFLNQEHIRKFFSKQEDLST